MVRSVSVVIGLLVCLAGAGCNTPWSQSTGRGASTEQPIKLDPQTRDELAWNYNEEGLKASKTGEHHKAVGWFLKAIRAEPGVSTFHNNLGRSLYWLGDFEGALAAYQKAQSLQPKAAMERASLKTNIGDVYRQKKDYTQAIRYYHEALQDSPDLARVHYELGNLYLKRRQMEKAEYRLNRAIELDKGYSRALVARVILYHLTYRDREAWEDVKELERRGYDVRQDLKQDILRGMQAKRDRERFRPAH